MHVNNRVLILREAITKIVPMLTQRSVKVTQRGTQAFVEWDRRTQKIKRLNLPYIPDDADDILLDATQGFLDHEVGHVLFTDQKLVLKAEKLKVHTLHNMIEDTFVERRMGEEFPGCGGNLTKMHGFFLTEYIEPQLKEHPQHAASILMVVIFRAWSGQPAFTDFMSSRWAIVEELVERLGDDFPKRLRDVVSTKDGLDLAVEARKRLEPPAPPVAPPAPPKPAAPPPGPEPEEEEDTMPEPGGSSGSGDSSAPPPLGPPEDDASPPADADGDDDEEGDDEPAPPSDMPPLPGDPEPEGEPLQEPPSAPNDDDQDDPLADDEDEPTGSASGGGTPEEPIAPEPQDEDEDEPFPELEEPSMGDGMPGGDPEDGAGEEGTSPGDDDAEGDDGAPGGNTGSGEPGGSSQPGEGDGTLPQPKEEPPARDFMKEFEDSGVKDFDDSAAEAISNAAAAATKNSDYTIFTRDEDTLEVLHPPEGFDQTAVTAMQKQCDHMVGPLQKDLQRAIASRSASVYTGGHRKGKLHGSSLARILAGRDDVFQQKQINKTKDVAVSLVVDASGSMCSMGKMQIAAYTAYALSSVLDNLGIPNEVMAFSTHDFSHDVLNAMAAEQRTHGFSYDRTSALDLRIVKGFQERVTPETRRRFAMLAQGGDMFEENVDGESVQIAHKRLSSQRQGRKVMMVLSDGQPACGGRSKALDDHLTDVVRQIEARGTEVVALGILDESVKKYYKRALVMNSVKDLPTSVMKELHRLLVQ